MAINTLLNSLTTGSTAAVRGVKLGSGGGMVRAGAVRESRHLNV